MSNPSPSFPSVIILDPTLPPEVRTYLLERSSELGAPEFKAPETWEDAKGIARKARGAAFVTARRLESPEKAFLEGANVVPAVASEHPRGFRFSGPLTPLELPPPPPPSTQDEDGALLFECPELAEHVAAELKTVAPNCRGASWLDALMIPDKEKAALVSRTEGSLELEQPLTFRSSEVRAWKDERVWRLLAPPPSRASGGRWVRYDRNRRGGYGRVPDTGVLEAPATLEAGDCETLLACLTGEDTIAWRFEGKVFALGVNSEEVRRQLAPEVEALTPAFAATLSKCWPPANPWTLLREDSPTWWRQLVREGQEAGLDLRALPRVLVGEHAAGPTRTSRDDRGRDVPFEQSVVPTHDQAARIRAKLSELAERPTELSFARQPLSFLLKRASQSDFLVLDGRDGTDARTEIMAHLGAGHCLSITLTEFPNEDPVPLLQLGESHGDHSERYDGGNVLLTLWRTTEVFLEAAPNPDRRRREEIAAESQRNDDDDWDDD